MSRQSISVALCLLWTVSGAPAFAKGPADQPSKKQIRAWIEQLANTSTFQPTHRPSQRLTAQDLESLKPVEEAYANLGKHIMVALPLLLEHTNDERYSYPEEHPLSGCFNKRTVSHACRSIIEQRIELYHPYLMLVDDREKVSYPPHCVNREWYAAAKGKDLYQLQLEAIEWALRLRPPLHVSKDKWDECIDRLRKYRDEFVKEGKADERGIGPPIEGK